MADATTDSALNLSDSDFMNQPPPAVTLGEGPEDTSNPNKEIDTFTEEEEVEEDSTQASESTDDDDGEGDESIAQEHLDDEDEEEEVGQPDGDTQKELETSSEDDSSDSINTRKSDKQDTEGDTPETEEFDYKSAFNEVTKPFKANGVEMQVKDPKDIISLMQMGANYQKKMAQLKPNLKVIKALENNGLLDEDKINHLIDLSKKDPKAIAKLIKESEIDPLDFDIEVAKDYNPTDYSVSDKEYQLDQVLDSIKGTETFSRTINVLTKEWDDASRTVISESPEVISIINAHMQNGVYDKVHTVMQQEKALGKFQGVSDVEAYRQVSEYLYQSGVLQDKSSKPKPTEMSTQDKKLDAKKAERKKKRKAVAPVKKSSPAKTSSTEDFLGLSDDEFMKKFAGGN